MKIIFLCGSLEPGCDGVGDYVRCLAAELVQQGHQAAIVALYDRQLSSVCSGTQEANDIALSILRIPFRWPVSEKFKIAGEWINQFNPDWLSLQYVPFSFQLKGLPFGLSSYLKKLGMGKRWHIMFHELWVGQEIESSPKHLLWGWVQQHLIHSLVSTLKPTIIHTQSQIHQALLAKLSITAQYLPLFSNIPVKKDKGASKSIRMKIPRENRKIMSLVMFGMIHPGAPVHELAKEAALYERKHGRKILLQLVGRCGQEQYRWETVWKSEGLEVELLGAQPSERISEILENATVGISTTPIGRIEKSGTVAAMREHKLPVVCVSRPWNARGVVGINLPPGVLEFRNGFFDACLAHKHDLKFDCNLSDIARQFTDNLLAAE